MELYFLSIWGLLLSLILYIIIILLYKKFKQDDSDGINDTMGLILMLGMNTIFLIFCIKGIIKLCNEFGC